METETRLTDHSSRQQNISTLAACFLFCSSFEISIVLISPHLIMSFECDYMEVRRFRGVCSFEISSDIYNPQVLFYERDAFNLTDGQINTVPFPSISVEWFPFLTYYRCAWHVQYQLKVWTHLFIKRVFFIFLHCRIILKTSKL
jgi:hypothetical protein